MSAPVPAPKPPPQLTQAELHALKLSEVEIRAALSEVEASKFRKLYALALLDPKGRVLAEEKKAADAATAVKDAKARYTATLARASTRLGLNLAACTFDADTGQVFPAPMK